MAASARSVSTRAWRPSTSTAPEATSATARGRSLCSTAWIRVARLASSSPGSTGTASWRRIGPPSSVSSTRWTVTPVTAAPWARASATAWAPGNAGRSDGCTLRTRPGHVASTRGPTMRMYPASTTMSTSTAANVSASVASSPPGISAVSNPCSAAQSSAGHARSAKTRTTEPPRPPRSPAAASARRFEPVPETPTAIRAARLTQRPRGDPRRSACHRARRRPRPRRRSTTGSRASRTPRSRPPPPPAGAPRPSRARR